MREGCACATIVLVLATVEHGFAQSQGSLPPSPQQPVSMTDGVQPKTPERPQFQLTTPGSQRPRLTRGSSRGQSLILTANLLSGYDDNAGATLGSGAGSVPMAPTSGASALGDVMLEYLRRTSRRSIVVRSLGNFVMYPNYLDQPAPGAKVRVRGTTELGRKHTLEASAQVRHEPFFTAGIGDRTDVVDVAGVVTPSASGGALPVTRLFERRSWVSSDKAYLTRRWSPRDTTVVSYLFFAQRFNDDNGNNHYHQAAASYSRTVTRSVTFGASYQYLNGDYSDYGARTRPLIEQTVEGGPTFVKRLAGRQLSVSLHSGGTSVETVDTVTREPYETWAPHAKAAATIQLPWAWRVSGGYARSYSVLQGLTADVYSTDAANITAGGPLAPRTDVIIDVSSANGRTLLVSGGSGTFNVSGGALQVRVALTSKMAATVGYFRYYQRYSNPAALPTGFPARYDRNAFLVGLTFWARMAGTLPAAPRAPGDW